MKHRVAFRKLNRTSAHRQAMLRTMVTQLVEHERIRTTLPKAKELRRVADKVVTLAKQDDEPARKRAESILRTPESVTKLFDVVGPRYVYVLLLLREGGYTRILKADFRKGDGAEMAVIEYIDRPGEMRKAKPPTGIEAARAVFDAQAEATQ
ncbi:hypothetical protein JG688_00013506 [Phytophthora aleatoria]|uniref:Large ribosomal subunit protein bL17c n=1 Tax=Phytophthora aleatoria TaxID=2496075 RepID=A0A8J5IM27_9STRA|nr:hypothetical protein JG688_00013506 [Phytophthora aleatoria]